MRALHRAEPPATYDPPLCWLPRQIDNSAGGQVWAPAKGFGPLSGQLLHLSYGRCRMMLLMRQEVDGLMQAGAADLGLQFLSGVCRGRFGPDGHLYLAGLDGWQTAAVQDGCLQRVRYTGKPARLPLGLKVRADGLELRFSCKLNRSARNVRRWRVEQWNYRWSADYGSKRWSAADPDREGPDALPVRSATLSPDGYGVVLKLDAVKPVMQMQIAYTLQTESNEPLAGVIHNTINRLPK
jgi:hypothetical protein